MTSMVFSNIGYMKKLKASGLTEAQSSVISEGFEQMRELQIEMATKGDIRNIREEILELKSDINQTKHAINSLEANLHSEVTQCRESLHQNIRELRVELKTEIKNTSAELSSQMKEQGSSLRSEMASLRNSLSEQGNGLRSEMNSLSNSLSEQGNSLRSEMNSLRNSLSEQGAGLRSEMNKLQEKISYQGNEFRLFKEEFFKKIDGLQKSLLNEWIAKTSVLFLMGLSIVLGVMVYLHR